MCWQSLLRYIKLFFIFIQVDFERKLIFTNRPLLDINSVQTYIIPSSQQPPYQLPMSSFLFPVEENKYSEVNNIRILLAVLKDDARRQPTVRISPFTLTTYKKYGYIKTIVAKCKYCDAMLKFKGVRTESDHYRDERFNHESSNSNPSYERIVNIVYKLTDFNNRHEHNREHTSQEQMKRKTMQRNELILDYYQNLLKESTNPNVIKSQIRKKFGIEDKQIMRIVHPFETVQRKYNYFKQNMRNMNFTIIQKFADLIDINKIKSNCSSYVDFPNQFTVITPTMVENFVKYGTTIYFGVYPEYISQSKKLILVGGFYGINEHHMFVPFATVILTLLKKEEQVIIFSNLLDIIDKEDDDIVKILMSIFRTFFNHYNKKVEARNFLLVVRQTSNTQAAIYEMRKEFPNLNFIYCFREKLNTLELDVNKRYCNDSYSSQQKLDFITALYSMVKTLEEEEYNTHLKNLFKKANTNNTLLLQKITEDSHLFCFSRIKDSSNNLYEQCIDEELRRKYQNVINTNLKSQHMFMNNILEIINVTIAYEKKNGPEVKEVELVKPAVAETTCPECKRYKAAKRQQFFNEIQLFELRIPELKAIRGKVCIKTYCLIMKQLVKCMSIKSMKILDDYNEKQYFVFKNGMKYKIIENQKTGCLQCDCEISKKYGLPCSHELFVCINCGINIEKQVQRWLL